MKWKIQKKKKKRDAGNSFKILVSYMLIGIIDEWVDRHSWIDWKMDEKSMASECLCVLVNI